MGLPTIEVASARATQAVLDNPHDREIWQPALAILKEQDGFINFHYGIGHEEKQTVYLVIAWESLEHHKRLAADTTTYPKLIAALAAAIIIDTVEAYHVEVAAREPYKAFAAPVLEIVIFSPREPENLPRATLEGLVEDLFVIGAPEAPNGPALDITSWGPVVEKPDSVALFLGWESVEAHYGFLNTTVPKPASIIKKIKDLAHFPTVHIPLTAL